MKGQILESREIIARFIGGKINFATNQTLRVETSDGIVTLNRQGKPLARYSSRQKTFQTRSDIDPYNLAGMLANSGYVNIGERNQWIEWVQIVRPGHKVNSVQIEVFWRDYLNLSVRVQNSIVYYNINKQEWYAVEDIRMEKGEYLILFKNRTQLQLKRNNKIVIGIPIVEIPEIPEPSSFLSANPRPIAVNRNTYKLKNLETDNENLRDYLRKFQQHFIEFQEEVARKNKESNARIDELFSRVEELDSLLESKSALIQTLLSKISVLANNRDDSGQFYPVDSRFLDLTGNSSECPSSNPDETDDLSTKLLNYN